ncbi:MAG TPA: DUF4271 domain-containing protein [Vicingus sp.]|nr:DUF4271 domain-containing protein [Vicingus sp.]HRP60537.1 DUF4271 domain-containing protein [Vicingus sp.]
MSLVFNNYQQQVPLSNKISSDSALTNLSDSNALDSVSQDTIYKLNTLEKIPFRKVDKEQNIDANSTKQVLFEPTLRTNINTTWPSIVLTLATLLLAFTKAFGLTRFRQIYKSLFSFYAAHEITREERVFFHRVNFSLFIIYLTNISLLLYFLVNTYKPESDTSFLFPIILMGVVLAYLIKFVSNAILAYVFSHEQMTPSYSYNVLLYNYLFGVFLIPALALIYFSNINDLSLMKFIIVPLILIVLTIRFIRFFVIGISNNISILYIILYICTLEILPLVVLGKFFI